MGIENHHLQKIHREIENAGDIRTPSVEQILMKATEAVEQRASKSDLRELVIEMREKRSLLQEAQKDHPTEPEIRKAILLLGEKIEELEDRDDISFREAA